MSENESAPRDDETVVDDAPETPAADPVVEAVAQEEAQEPVEPVAEEVVVADAPEASDEAESTPE
ncbi:MAG: hypothetical protein WD532_08175, partial [Acidimicrobiia bacterium]